MNPFLGWSCGYGYDWKLACKPILILWLTLAYFAFVTWHTGNFAPNSAVILTSEEWKKYDKEDYPAEVWGENTVTGKDWTTFNSFVWTADAVIPLVEFGQTDAWAPSPDRGWLGGLLLGLQWLFGFLGWFVVGLLAAGLTGYTTRRD